MRALHLISSQSSIKSSEKTTLGGAIDPVSCHFPIFPYVAAMIKEWLLTISSHDLTNQHIKTESPFTRSKDQSFPQSAKSTTNTGCITTAKSNANANAKSKTAISGIQHPKPATRSSRSHPPKKIKKESK